jgi:hypothetical protein
MSSGDLGLGVSLALSVGLALKSMGSLLGN